MLWLFVGVVVFAVAMFFFGDLDRITVHHILHYIDFRHWPLSFGIALWLLFAWLALDAAIFHYQPGISLKSTKTQRFRRIRVVQWFVFIGILLFLANTFFAWQMIWRWFYFSILISYYFEPMAMFFYDGTITFRLIFPPLTGAAAIGYLLYLNHKFKKRDTK